MSGGRGDFEPYQVLFDAGDGAETPEVVWSARGFEEAWRGARTLAAQRAPKGATWAAYGEDSVPRGVGALRAALAPPYVYFDGPRGGIPPRGRVSAALVRREWFGVFRGTVAAWYGRPASPLRK